MREREREREREGERERERELVESRRWLLRTCTKAEIKVGFNKRGGGKTSV